MSNPTDLAPVFVDSNVFLRHLLADLPEQAERASRFLEHIETGAIQATCAATVIVEVVYVLERTYKVPRSEIVDHLGPLLAMVGLRFPDKLLILEALDHYRQLNVPFADALHAGFARASGATRIASFDRHFDCFPGIERVEP